MEIVNWVQTNWQAIIVALCAIDQLLGVIAPLTPWEFDDRLSRILAKGIASLVKKSPTGK